MPTAELERLSPMGLGRRAVADHAARRSVDPPRGGVADPAATDDVAVLFPAGRPCDAARSVLSFRSDSAFDACSSPTAWIVAAGLEPLDPVGRRRIFDGWRRQGRRVRSVVTDEGCDVRIGTEPVAETVRAALLEWLPLSEAELAVFDEGLFRDSAPDALTLLVRPPTVWSLGDAMTADSLFPRPARFEPRRFEALEQLGGARVRGEHVSRLRAATTRIASQLPVAGFPVASGTIARACSAVATDDDWCRAIAARQLARYASSAFVGRRSMSGTREPLPRTAPGVLGHPTALRGA